MKNKKKLIIVSLAIAIIIAIIIAILMNNNDNKPITYSIHFETNGGSLVETQIINEGEKVIKPSNPTKDGYMFVEWTYQDNTYDFGLEVTSNLTLIAKWTELEDGIEKFIVKFNSDGGTTISNQIIEKGNKAEKPIAPTKEGYTFMDWTLNGKNYNFDTPIEEDLELKAKWEKVKESNNDTTKPTTPTVKKYTVKFDSNGGNAVSSQTINEGGKVTKPSDPTRNGYTFAGWTLNGNAYNFSLSVTSNITLVAKWTEAIKNKYTVTFDSKGGTAVSSQTIVEGNKATKPTNPTKSGYNFNGWTLNGSDYNFDSSVTSNITLVAKWTQKSYSVVANKVDNISPARVLTVYEDGNVITVQTIQYSDGTTLCAGNNLNVNYYALEGETSLKLVLSSGTIVTASLKIN